MAHFPFSLLILRRISLSSPTAKLYRSSPYHLPTTKPFSTAPAPSSSSSGDPNQPPPPSSLSARLRFVFDKIDAIERDRSEKDDTLQRIRAWRESRKHQQQPPPEEPQESELAHHGEIANSNSPAPSSSSSRDPDPAPPSSLSARLSYVFDQIDAIERDRSEKDDTRTRAWPESRKPQQQQPPPPPPEEPQESELADHSEIANSNSAGSDSVVVSEPDTCEAGLSFGAKAKSEVELVHPWPEWIELMERLVQQNYFDHRRKDEDRMIQDLGFDRRHQDYRAGGDAGDLDFKNFKLVQTACINFGKDRFDILRSLSRQDIQILVGFGCPSADKKVVFSAKLLRKHVHLDEGDVCSSCSLRNSCERAYLLTLKEDEARTIDVMRVLLAYGFDPLNGSVANQSLLKQKSVKTVVRKLLHEVVKLSSVPIDPNLPPPIIKKPPPKVKQPPPPPRKRVGRDDIEMKKGDWLCPKCDFMNFAKNTVCLQCDAKRPKRQLLPGEWECPQCNFLNYRRNTVCFHCDCKRPPDEFMENKMQERRHGPGMRVEKTPNRSEVSNAWNFDFDDDESDGADVAAFEYADSPVKGQNSPLDNQAKEGNFGRPDYDFDRASREPRIHDGEYSHAYTSRPHVGFDDFDDEEDDIDNYELETGNRNSVPMVSSNDLSEFEGHCESDDGVGSDYTRKRTKSPSYNKRSKPMHKRRAFSGSDDNELASDSDSELSPKPKWKSSHVADFRPSGRGKLGSKGPSKGLSFGSEDELGLYSDMDDDLDKNYGLRQGKANDFRRRKSFNSDDDPFSGSASDNDNSHSRRGRFGAKAESNRKGKDSKRQSDYNFARDAKFRSNGTRKGQRNSFEDDDDFDGSSRGFPRRGFRGNSNRQRTSDRREGDRKNFKGPRNGGFANRQGERRNAFDRNMKDTDFGEFRNSRRVIER